MVRIFAHILFLVRTIGIKLNHIPIWVAYENPGHTSKTERTRQFDTVVLLKNFDESPGVFPDLPIICLDTANDGKDDGCNAQCDEPQKTN